MSTPAQLLSSRMQIPYAMYAATPGLSTALYADFNRKSIGVVVLNHVTALITNPLSIAFQGTAFVAHLVHSAVCGIWFAASKEAATKEAMKKCAIEHLKGAALALNLIPVHLLSMIVPMAVDDFVTDEKIQNCPFMPGAMAYDFYPRWTLEESPSAINQAEPTRSSAPKVEAPRPVEVVAFIERSAEVSIQGSSRG